MSKCWETVWEVSDPNQTYRQVERRHWPLEKDAVIYLRNIFELTDDHFAQLKTGFVETQEGRFTLQEVDTPEVRRSTRWGVVPEAPSDK